MIQKLTNWLRQFLAFEPALTGWLVNGGAALILAYVFHLSRVQEGAAVTVVTACVGLYTAVLARKVSVGLITGAFATLAAAAAAFHFKVSPDALAMADAVAAFVIPLLFRPGTHSLAYLREQQKRSRPKVTVGA